MTTTHQFSALPPFWGDHVIDVKTWGNGQKIEPADMRRYVSDVLQGLMAPPACRRTVADVAAQQKSAGAYHVLQLDKPGMGTGAMHSFDSTGGQMSKDPFKIHAPLDGLYEVSCGVVVRAVSGSLGFVAVAMNKNQTAGSTIAATSFCRTGAGRTSAAEKVGAATATIPLAEGDFVSVAVHSDTDFCFGDGSFAQFVSHVDLRWVGVKP
ncbi:hypothetical protein ACMA1D_18085 [Streptomyces sp. 796.1]|uniref:hypothetical protein n=1 Tax=Streptomyces sp. 796.1 TaxID=3163029 RepID=UPI0039C8E497